MTTDRHDRYWPRDAPIRWAALVRRLVLWLVAIGSAAAHLALAVLYVSAIEGGTVTGVGAWILALAWIGLAAFAVWSWWFFRWRIVLAPITGAFLLWLLTSWS